MTKKFCILLSALVLLGCGADNDIPIKGVEGFDKVVQPKLGQKIVCNNRYFELTDEQQQQLTKPDMEFVQAYHQGQINCLESINKTLYQAKDLNDALRILQIDSRGKKKLVAGVVNTIGWSDAKHKNQHSIYLVKNSADERSDNSSTSLDFASFIQKTQQDLQQLNSSLQQVEQLTESQIQILDELVQSYSKQLQPIQQLAQMLLAIKSEVGVKPRDPSLPEDTKPYDNFGQKYAAYAANTDEWFIQQVDKADFVGKELEVVMSTFKEFEATVLQLRYKPILPQFNQKVVCANRLPIEKEREVWEDSDIMQKFFQAELECMTQINQHIYTEDKLKQALTVFAQDKDKQLEIVADAFTSLGMSQDETEDKERSLYIVRNAQEERAAGQNFASMIYMQGVYTMMYFEGLAQSGMLEQVKQLIPKYEDHFNYYQQLIIALTKAATDAGFDESKSYTHGSAEQRIKTHLQAKEKSAAYMIDWAKTGLENAKKRIEKL